MTNEIIQEIDLNLKIKLSCKEGEERDVKERFKRAVKADIERMEGILNTSRWNPFSKSYYFSVKGVDLK